MMIIIQVAFAFIAFFRGWGFAPFGVMLFTFLIGSLMGLAGIPFLWMYFAIDFIATGALAFMVFNNPLEELNNEN